MKKELKENNWTELFKFANIKKDSTFIKKAGSVPKNTFHLSDYAGFIWSVCMDPDLLSEYKQKYPGTLFLGAATYEFLNSKAMMYEAFCWNDTLKLFKPHSKAYKKRYSKTLAKEIINDFGGKIVVIKPLKGTRGNGILITESSALDRTLKYILSKKSKKKLFQNSDGSYSHWALDSSDSFVIEEFIPSDPVSVHHLDNKSYDGTMRVACCMVYDKQEIEVNFLGGYWKLPRKSVTDKGTLNECHKSCGDFPYYSKVDPEVLDEVQIQLSEALILLYRQMLGLYTDRE